MPSNLIAYDALKTSLYSPGMRETVFTSAELTVTDSACAELCRLVYLPFEQDAAAMARLKHDLDCGGFELRDTFNAAGTQAILIFHPNSGQTVLVFRGTQADDVTDIGTDLAAWKAGSGIQGQVHAGFKNALAAVWPNILSKHASTLKDAVFTGHSLGAALATLAIADIAHRLQGKPSLVTIGSPAVGDLAFVNGLQQLQSRRYANCCDVVTKLPPEFMGFQHLGAARYIDRTGRVNLHLTAGQEALDQQAARMAYLLSNAWRWGHVGLRDLADHSPINYVRALWS